MNLKQDILNFIHKNRNYIVDMYFNLLFAWLPVKKNKIVFSNNNGFGFGCNPKYIAEEIIRQNLPYELVWITKPEFMNKNDFPNQVRLVNRYNVNKVMYEYATAGIWIDNTIKVYLLKRGLRKKQNQFFINTWHGSLGIKRIYGDVTLWKEYAFKESRMFDLMVSNSNFETNVFQKDLLYEKNIIKTGHPRNDVFFKDNKNLKNEILKKLNINPDKKIVLYAPSFRDNLRVDCFNINYRCLENYLREKTGKDWIILSKFHPFNVEQLKYISGSDFRYDVSFYPDIQELLFISDIMISDYSSCMFDFMLTKKPCFIYATDIEQYNNERGFYYPLEETPFPIARNNGELIKNIQDFNLEQYQKECENFLCQKDAQEDGFASKRVVDIIAKLKNS